ncbi:MAG: metallophosphoesterase [Candidatus Fimenecus sp.]
MTKKEKVTKGFKITICVLLAAVILTAGILFFPLTGKKHTQIWSAGDTFDVAKIQTVSKDRADFKILMFTDTQLWSDLTENKKCYEQMDALVEQTQPDLIILPGDNISAFASRFSINNFIKHMDRYQIPWAPVFGNHDSEIPTTSRNWQADKYMQSEYCLMEKGPSNLYGCGNYVLNITENGEPVYSLFLFDNGEYIKYDSGETKEVYMGYEQIAWYEWNVKGIAAAAGRTVPSMTFSHFAQPEFKEAVEQYGIQNADGSYTIPEEYGFGKCAYLPGTAPVKSGFFEKCQELSSTKYMFCGHDHENNASVTYEGITMTYGLKTGPSPVPWNFAEETGGTLITVSGQGENQTVNIENIVIG